MATTGTATLDFGAFPGTTDTSVAITGQAAIIAGSLVEAWIRPVATADHTADEHMIESIKVYAGNISAGVGFTIYGFCTNDRAEPVVITPHPTSVFTASATAIGIKSAQPGKPILTTSNTEKLYGTWTVAWVWT